LSQPLAKQSLDKDKKLYCEMPDLNKRVLFQRQNAFAVILLLTFLTGPGL